MLSETAKPVEEALAATPPITPFLLQRAEILAGCLRLGDAASQRRELGKSSIILTSAMKCTMFEVGSMFLKITVGAKGLGALGTGMLAVGAGCLPEMAPCRIQLFLQFWSWWGDESNVTFPGFN